MTGVYVFFQSRTLPNPIQLIKQRLADHDLELAGLPSL